MALLIALSGLPGVGKTTLARHVATARGAAYLRVDTIEAALRTSSLAIHPAEDAGYRVAAALAKDNLAAGRDVLADAVSPIAITRRWWTEAAAEVGAAVRHVEVVCTDPAEHRRRVESRRSDLPGLVLPSWADVCAHRFDEWTTDRLRIDTAGRTSEESAEELLAALYQTC